MRVPTTIFPPTSSPALFIHSPYALPVCAGSRSIGVNIMSFGEFQDSRQESPGSLSPRFVVQCFRLWWYVAIPAGLLFSVLAAAVVWATWTPVFEAKASVRIKEKEDFIYQRGLGGQNNFASKQKGIITSRVVLGRAVSRPQLRHIEAIFGQQREPIEALRELIAIRHDGGDYYLITCQHPDPESAKLIVNAVLDAYTEQIRYFDDARVRSLLEKLAKEINKQETQVKTLKRQLSEQAAGLLDVNPRLGRDFWRAGCGYAPN